MLNNLVVLLTGGAGSFAEEFVKRTADSGLRALRLFDTNEYLLWVLKNKYKYPHLRFLLGDIRDKDRLKRAVFNVDIVIHAAALKHVDLCEYNPIETVRVNIDGSINVIDACIDAGVKKVLGISSDKAVHPVGIYGASKLTMEKLFINANVYGSTKFSCVRFGNFGGHGSILELWAQKAERGEEIEVTDLEMTRLYLNLESAVDFGLRCIDMMEGGEIFIPKMERKTLKELIEMIAPGSKYKLIGKRPGEKMHEQLYSDVEVPEEYEDYYILRERTAW